MKTPRLRRVLRFPRIYAVLAVTFLGFAASACDDDPVEEIGDELQDAGEAAEDAAENAGDAIEDTLDGDGR